MASKNVGKKTVLFLLDGLYSGNLWNSPPQKWQLAPFAGDYPSSIFASQDPVAIDSVGLDFLRSEWELLANADNYLHEAALIGTPPSGTAYKPDGVAVTQSLGVHEHWNNSASKQYSRNLDPVNGKGIELVRAENYFTGGTGGTTSTGGTSSTGGAAASGGRSATGGTLAGSTGGRTNTGGASTGTATAAATGGLSAGGARATGGSAAQPATGGAVVAASSAGGSSSATGGNVALPGGGASAIAGGPDDSAGGMAQINTASSTSGAAANDAGGCGCRVARNGNGWFGSALAIGLVLAARRRATRRKSAASLKAPAT